jgi:Asp-tRNA(Asn)/Glu-tRNA(Gln) amidotransferase A subunit family amidase
MAPMLLRAQTNAPITTNDVRGAEQLIGLDFSDQKLDLMLPGLREELKDYENLRKLSLSNSVPPAVTFNPIPVGFKFPPGHSRVRWTPPGKVRVPASEDELAFYSVSELGALLKSRRVSSERLTRLYLERLKKFGPKLECVITLTEELALAQARRADAEIAAGRYRGPLHGIPYAAKDLLAVKGLPTTWGAAPYTNQVFDANATVIQRLEDAGAVLVAKTTLGELAMGDIWFGGKTRNPWDVKQGSSGSSAGSAAGTAAGLFAFAIGSETYGSIVSPCDRCGATGLRPSYGRVSRTGAMVLSWSMDKLGPICRRVEDCALVFNAIYGPDGKDQTLYDAPFRYDPKLNLKKLRIGYVKTDFDKEKGERKEHDQVALEMVRGLGVDLLPVELPDYPQDSISLVLSTEGAAAFESLTRDGHEDWLKQQTAGAWPNIFRTHRFVPAVEYLQAQRARYLLIQETARVFDKVDLFLAPSLSGKSLLLGNLTGLPCVVVPNGFSTNNTPTSICFVGKLFGDGELLSVARRYQEQARFYQRRPALE